MIIQRNSRFKLLVSCLVFLFSGVAVVGRGAPAAEVVVTQPAHAVETIGSKAQHQAASSLLSPEGYWLVFSKKNNQLRSVVQLTINKDGLLSGSFVAILYVPGHVWDDACQDCMGQFHGKPLIGMTFLWGLQQQVSTSGVGWVKGKVFNPDVNQTYSASLFVKDDGRTIRFKGCKFIACRSSTWTRISASQLPYYIAKSKKELATHPFSQSRT